MTTFTDGFIAQAWDAIKAEHGVSLIYKNTDTGVSQTIVMTPREFVGAIDEFGRKVFRFSVTDLTVRTGEPKRGDEITDSQATWTITDVRFLASALYEIRCDAAVDRG